MAKLRTVFINGASPQITLEVNPQSTSSEKIAVWKSLGINRISIGVQSFDQKVLEDYHRATDVEQIVHVIRQVARSGMLFNVDLLYGSRSQTESSFKADVQRAIDLSAPHDGIGRPLRAENQPPRMRSPLWRGSVPEVSRDVFDMLAAVGHVEITPDHILVRRPFRQGMLIMSTWFDAIRMPKDPSIEEILEHNPRSRGPSNGVDRSRLAGLN
jgi:hypothetical protein